MRVDYPSCRCVDVATVKLSEYDTSRGCILESIIGNSVKKDVEAGHIIYIRELLLIA